MNSLPRTSGIYKITCTANGKIYIGSSFNMHLRQLEHCRRLQRGSHHSSHLQNAWNKYGEDSFVFTVLEECPSEGILDREQHYLDLFQSYLRNIGFNIGRKAGAAMAGRPLTNAHRNKVSLAIRAYYSTDEGRAKKSKAMMGRKLSEASREKIRLSNLGQKRTEETRENIKQSRIGKKASEETIARMRVAQSGKKMSPEAIAKTVAGKEKMFIVTTPSGIEITVKGLAQFCRENGLNRGNMMSVVAGKRNHNHGWKCRYA